MDNLEQRFGAVIRRRRVAAEIGQEEFAAQAGLHRTHVSLIERGKRSPTLAVVQKLAAALSTTMASLLEETESARAGAGEKTLPPGRPRKESKTGREGPG